MNNHRRPTMTGNPGTDRQSQIWTILSGPPAPLLIVTRERGTPKWAAIKPNNSRLAFPSTGADFTRAIQVPPDSSSRLMREFALTVTRIFLIYSS